MNQISTETCRYHSNIPLLHGKPVCCGTLHNLDPGDLFVWHGDKFKVMEPSNRCESCGGLKEEHPTSKKIKGKSRYSVCRTFTYRGGEDYIEVRAFIFDERGGIHFTNTVENFNAYHRLKERSKDCLWTLWA